MIGYPEIFRNKNSGRADCGSLW